jgi:uridine kinase
VSVSELDRLIAKRRERLNRPVLVAVDGRSGTGKSTLAAEVAERYRGGCITADDFWSGGAEDYWQALAPDERADRAIDWRRLRAEVLEPLLAGRPASWRTFNC